LLEVAAVRGLARLSQQRVDNLVGTHARAMPEKRNEKIEKAK
jgi:hypothetical protein